MAEPAPPLCWCCLRYFLQVPAVCARSGLCGPCLTESPKAVEHRPCAERHMAQALAAAGGPGR